MVSPRTGSPGRPVGTDRGIASITVTIRNPRFPAGAAPADLSLSLTWGTDTLPRLIQWRMPGAGDHVLGVEPANCSVMGRAQAREEGSLVILQPGQHLEYHLVLDVTVDSGMSD